MLLICTGIAQYNVDIAIVLFCVRNKKYCGVPGMYLLYKSCYRDFYSNVPGAGAWCMYNNMHFRVEMDVW